MEDQKQTTEALVLTTVGPYVTVTPAAPMARFHAIGMLTEALAFLTSVEDYWLRPEDAEIQCALTIFPGQTIGDDEEGAEVV